MTKFAGLLEAIDQLSVDEQEELTEIVRRRLVERGRQQAVREAQEAEQELAAGGCRVASVDDLMGEMLS